MHLYNVNLQRPSAITCAVCGSFSDKRIQQILVSKGTILQLLTPDRETGQLHATCTTNVFGIIRSIIPFRLTGTSIDYIVIGSDSGKIAILQYNAKTNSFDKVQEEMFGKSGCRRIVPGQYLAADPHGRAVMIGAVEKQKFVYVLNRDSESNLIISSPLEAHRSHSLIFDMVGVDVGFENPLFAALEVDYDEFDQPERQLDVITKKVTYYELDLGVNHVTRRHTQQVDSGATMLVSVPGDGISDGPGGILVCCENMLVYTNINQDVVEVLLPRRFGMMDHHSLMIVAKTVHQQKGLFFFILQNEYGDLYKVSLQCKKHLVTGILVQYFDTIPVTKEICILKTGYLFAASEFGNHYLFQFLNIGDNEAAAVVSSTGDSEYVYFRPRKPVNLILVDVEDSLAPILDFKVADLTHEDIPQIYTLCGRGHRSSLKVLRYGLAVTEMAVSDVHGVPSAVWTVGRSQFDEFIVVSYSNATIVLSIGDTVQEVPDSGFDDQKSSILVGVLGTTTLVQVCPSAIRLIGDRVNEWRPGRKSIVRCCMNSKQVVVALGGGELVYLEHEGGTELREITRFEAGSEVCALSISSLQQGFARGRYLAVGTVNNRVRLFAMEDPNDPLRALSVQDLSELPESLLISNLRGDTYLSIGLRNGIFVRSLIDETTSTIRDTRKNFLGTQPVKLFEVKVQEESAILALSSRSWLCYNFQKSTQLSPLSYESLEYCSGFCSEQCPEGLVAIAGTTLRILALEKIGDLFNQTMLRLSYTPRRLLIHPTSNKLVLLESDHRTYPEKMRKELFEDAMDEDLKNDHDELDEDDEEELATFTGHLKNEIGKWASCIRIVDPLTLETNYCKEFEDNEVGVSMAMIEFSERGSEIFLAVGTVKDLVLQPRSFSAAYITLYRFSRDGRILDVLHKVRMRHKHHANKYQTSVDDIPLCIAPFQGRLLAGVGRALRIYDIGKLKLLRKCENRTFPSVVMFIDSRGDRIYVGDSSGSVFMVKYRKAEKQLLVFADCFSPKYLTKCCVLDFNSVASGDKFGNMFVHRLPEEVSDDVENDPNSSEFVYGSEGWLGGAANKLREIIHFFIADTITAMEKTSFIPGDQGALLYGTIFGAIGVLIPFTSREDIDFFQHLEMHMRQIRPPLCGRDHLVFRSYYTPVKDTIDGDLCEQFNELTYDEQAQIAHELLCEPTDVVRKLEEMRNRFV